MPTTTTKMVCEDLMLVGLLTRDKDSGEIGDKTPYIWQLSNVCSEFLKEAEIFDDTPF